MRKITRIAASVMALTLMVGSVTACGGNNETGSKDENKATDKATEVGKAVDVELTVWAPTEEQADYSKINADFGTNFLKYECEKFAEANKDKWNIKFNYATCAEDKAKDELSKDPKKGADVFMMAGDHVYDLANNGILQAVITGKDDIVANNTEKAIQAGTVKVNGEESLYGVPFTPNSWFMYYDKSKFSEDEIKSLDVMMAKDLDKGVYNICFPLDNSWYNPAFFFAAGCTLFGPDGKDGTACDFDNENGVKAAEYMIDLANNKKFKNDVKDSGLGLLAEGKAGAWFSGTWNAAKVKEALGENYGAAKLPTIKIDGEDKQLSSFADYKFIGINVNAQGDKQKAAQALAAWLGGEEMQKARFQARAITPTWASLAESDEVKNDIASAALMAETEVATTTPSIAQMTKFWDPSKAIATGMLEGSTTKTNVKAELSKMVKQILTKLD